MNHSLLVLLLLYPLVEGWTNNGVRPPYPNKPIEIGDGYTEEDMVKEKAGDAIVGVANIGANGWESSREVNQWVMIELPDDVFQIWQIKMTHDFHQGQYQPPRNQRIRFMGSLFPIDIIGDTDTYPDPNIPYWHSFYVLEGPVYTENIDICISNHQGIARTLALYSEHDQGMDFKSIELYGYVRLDQLSAFHRESPALPISSIEAGMMSDGDSWKPDANYEFGGINEMYVCNHCNDTDGYKREHHIYWTLVIANMHSQESLRNLSVYATNRNPERPADSFEGGIYPTHRLQPLHTITSMNPNSGIEIIALEVPVFTAMFIFHQIPNNHTYKIEELYLFGALLSPLKLGAPGQTESSDNFQISSENWYGQHPVNYLGLDELLLNDATNWEVEDVIEETWMKIMLGGLHRIIHVTTDVFVFPYHEHHVEIGVFQTDRENRPEDAEYIEIFNSDDQPERMAMQNYTDGILGFYSAEVSPSMIALEVMFIVFVDLWPGQTVYYHVEMSTFELITLGDDNICDFKPGAHHMREFVAPWETSKIGSTLDLNCNSEAFALTCPKCTKTVQCVEEQDDKGIAQAYWDTTETQQSLCHEAYAQFCLTMNIWRDLPDEDDPDDDAALGAAAGEYLKCLPGYQFVEGNVTADAKSHKYRTYLCHIGEDQATRSWKETEQLCTDVNECMEMPYICSGSGKCVNTAGSYTCICADGWGKRPYSGSHCKDLDECLMETHNCDCRATCYNTWGSYFCKCSAGYYGNGIDCYEDESVASDDDKGTFSLKDYFDQKMKSDRAIYPQVKSSNTIPKYKVSYAAIMELSVNVIDSSKR